MNKETLSALVDDACSRDELGDCIDRLLGCDQSKATLGRYQLIGAAIRDHASASAGFASRVSAAIAAEPALEPASTVVSLGAERAKRAGRQTPRFGFANPRVGLALAASVAVAAIGGVLTLGSVGGDEQPVLVARDAGPAQRTAATNIVPAVAQRDSSAAARRVDWNQVDAETARQLNGYLLNHNRYRSAHGQGVGGTLGYARVATYEPEAAPAADAAESTAPAADE